MKQLDVIVIGAGAAGLMCAIEAGRRGRKVLVLDHAKRIGKKILLSGGGRCNFTNINAGPDNFISANPHFAKSALSRYTPADFIALVEKHGISYHEKKLGQLFCDNSAKDIVAMLADECKQASVQILTRCDIDAVSRNERFELETSLGSFSSDSLVVACGGLSFPTMGASDFGYRLAGQFGLKVLPTRAALVPLTLDGALKRQADALSGVSLDCEASAEDGTGFRENLLFTHRGLSGPAILQVSSYWREGEAIRLDLFPGESAAEWLRDMRQQRPRARLTTILAERLPKRFVEELAASMAGDWPGGNLADCSNRQLDALASRLDAWQLVPAGSEGYRTAEVTLGGVDTAELSSQTMAAKQVPGLYFIGEVVDVTGWLGGYNFQWAWASGWCAGQAC
ncbi:MAG: NAD(P)/FAD-dependent oxidoreductase [Gammaproteobacteria bacterium]|nr:NAD(P)/FAD-dependent oxidoreductase [Gammaproteobacteria bacterium]